MSFSQKTSHLPEVSAVVARMKQCLDVKTDQELAEALGFHQTVISKWKTRGEIPVRTLIKIAKRLKRSTTWVLTGRESDAAIADLKRVIGDLDQWLAAHAPAEVQAPWSETLSDLLAKFPWSDPSARDLLLAFLSSIKEASGEDRAAVQTCIRALTEGSHTMRVNVLAQMKLMEQLLAVEVVKEKRRR